MDVQVKLELGHRAEFRDKVTPEGYTHDWTVFVRGPQDKPVHHFIDKVVFYLHESFAKSRRVVKEPPYQIKESGYAGFTLPIEVYFKNKDEPKKLVFEYDLFLHLQGCPPVNHVRCEKLTFRNPTPEFQKKLLKAGGVIVSDNSTATPKSAIKPLVDDKKEIKAASKSIKKSATLEDRDSFTSLFGDPLKSTNTSLNSNFKKKRLEPSLKDASPISTLNIKSANLLNKIGRDDQSTSSIKVQSKINTSPLFDTDSNDSFEDHKKHHTKMKKEKKRPKLDHDIQDHRSAQSSTNAITIQDLSKTSFNPSNLTVLEQQSVNKPNIPITTSGTLDIESDMSSPVKSEEDMEQQSHPKSSNDNVIIAQTTQMTHPTPPLNANRINQINDANNYLNSHHDDINLSTIPAKKMCKSDTSSNNEESDDDHTSSSDSSTDNDQTTDHDTAEKEDADSCKSNYVMEMLNLQRDLMALQDKHIVQKIVDIIVETRKFTISPSTFDFDLCKLDESTLQRIKHIIYNTTHTNNNVNVNINENSNMINSGLYMHHHNQHQNSNSATLLYNNNVNVNQNISSHPSQ